MLLPVYICLLARLLRNSYMDLDEMLLVDRRRYMDELMNFWAWSGLYPDAGTKLLSPIQLQRCMQRGVRLTWASEPSKHLCRRYMRSTEFPYSCKIQYGAKTENDIKNRKLSCSGQIISLPNGENRAKIRKGTAEILWRIYKKFTFLPAIFRLSSTLKLYNFYTVQDRGIQSAYEMLRMKRAF